MTRGGLLMLLLAGGSLAQSRESIIQLSPGIDIRVIVPDKARYSAGAPVVAHVGQKGKDVPARLSPFGFIDVMLPEGATNAAEALGFVQTRLRTLEPSALHGETGVISWSNAADRALTLIAANGRDVRWYVSERGTATREHVAGALAGSPKFAAIVWASESDRHAFDQYEALQSAGVRWIRLNASAQYLGEITGRNSAHLPENPPNARFDRETYRSALALDPANGGNASSLGVTAAALELADRTRRGEW
jgi:hypothetical protein